MDYKAIARALRDPENQPHQWNDQELAEFFVTAADEIERLREALKLIAAEPIHQCVSRLTNPPICDRAWIARSALQQKDSE